MKPAFLLLRNLYKKDRLGSFAEEGKCSLCRKKGGVFLVELQIPSFSKGIAQKDAPVCYGCLKAIHEIYIGYSREQEELEHEKGRIHGHEHVYDHA